MLRGKNLVFKIGFQGGFFLIVCNTQHIKLDNEILIHLNFVLIYFFDHEQTSQRNTLNDDEKIKENKYFKKKGSIVRE